MRHKTLVTPQKHPIINPVRALSISLVGMVMAIIGCGLGVVAAVHDWVDVVAGCIVMSILSLIFLVVGAISLVWLKIHSGGEEQ